MSVFYETRQVPVNSCLLVDSLEDALSYPRGDIALAVCDGCGFVRNTAFDPAKTEYSGRYEETQAYSATFNRFHRALAEDLVNRHNIRRRHVVEIGCGKGEFLGLICRLGANTGQGYDPSFDDERGILDDLPGVRVANTYFDRDSGRRDADVLVCKMTLEHIQNTADFVGAASRALRSGDDSLAYFQIPESLRILRNCAFEDIYFEHCSYFTPGSLARLFRQSGFRVERLDLAYDGQYLTIEARPDASASQQQPLEIEEPPEVVSELAATFARRCGDTIAAWQDRLEDCATRGPVVIWGSGSKGVAFLHAMADAGKISAAVDINPHRQGKFMPGTGQPIVAPSDLRALQPHAIVIMNPIYRDEIVASTRAAGLDCDHLTL